MRILTKRGLLLAGLLLLALASVLQAQDRVGAIDLASIENVLKFGALGLTALGLILGFYLLNNGRNGPGYAYLAVVLIAGFTFLYAEVSKAKPGIDLVLTPTQFSPSEVAPTLVYNQTPLTADQGGRYALKCDDRVLLTVNLDHLVNALNDARRKTLAAASQASVANQANVGFDGEAGGMP